MPETIVLIHGLRGRADEWMPQRIALEAAGLTVIAPDLPGHGGRSTEPFSTGEALATISDAVDLADDAPLLVGRALGAHLAIEFASLSSLASGLVAIGCGTQSLGWLQDSYRIALASHQLLPDRGAALGALGASQFTGSVSRHRRDSAPDAFADTMRGLATLDTLSALRRVDSPVWLLNGQFDLFRLHERAFLGAAKSATLVRQPGARLATGIRNPAETNRLLLGIVARWRAGRVAA